MRCENYALCTIITILVFRSSTSPNNVVTRCRSVDRDIARSRNVNNNNNALENLYSFPCFSLGVL